MKKLESLKIKNSKVIVGGDKKNSIRAKGEDVGVE